jgi:hypothetical protein
MPARRKCPPDQGVELAERSFDFATQVLNTQCDMTLQLINAGGTATQTRATR